MGGRQIPNQLPAQEVQNRCVDLVGGGTILVGWALQLPRRGVLLGNIESP